MTVEAYRHDDRALDEAARLEAEADHLRARLRWLPRKKSHTGEIRAISAQSLRLLHRAQDLRPLFGNPDAVSLRPQ